MASARIERPAAGPIEDAIRYHDRTKHHFGRYARSLGYMDWDTQPNPFRTYSGSSRIALAHPPMANLPTYDRLFGEQREPPREVTHETISQFFYESLAISAWKQIGSGKPWSLRVNPSSGDLHPTEGYLIAGPVSGIGEEPAVYHYNVYEHALERRITLTADEWTALARQLPVGAFLVALASIFWRESWKYGERAFRYCHHDVGHAIGSLAFSAAVLGWRSRLVVAVADNDLNVLIGVAGQHGAEAEHGDCLIAIAPVPDSAMKRMHAVRLPDALLERLSHTRWAGTPDPLSVQHYAWPIIEEVSAVCRYEGELIDEAGETVDIESRRTAMPDRGVSVRELIRQRRSAVAMDGETGISRAAFYRMLMEVMPVFAPFPFEVLPWQARVSLALFVHRVEGVQPGLYLLVRHPRHEPLLAQQLSNEFLWQRPPDCPDGLPLYLLIAGDAQQAAKTISCHQDIAADGAFAMGMLAHFESTLRECGAWMYPRLFWETGLIGQVLYLGAEAASIRATGIGCFFDDPMHELLHIRDHQWQSLYHFTVGGAIDDQRLTTRPPYWHLPEKR